MKLANSSEHDQSLRPVLGQSSSRVVAFEHYFPVIRSILRPKSHIFQLEIFANDS